MVPAERIDSSKAECPLPALGIDRGGGPGGAGTGDFPTGAVCFFFGGGGGADFFGVDTELPDGFDFGGGGAGFFLALVLTIISLD